MSDSEEDVWRQRVMESERRYRQASRSYQETVEANADEATIASAAEQMNASREEFHRALRAFSDIVIRGKTPRNSG